MVLHGDVEHLLVHIQKFFQPLIAMVLITVTTIICNPSLLIVYAESKFKEIVVPMMWKEKLCTFVIYNCMEWIYVNSNPWY